MNMHLKYHIVISQPTLKTFKAVYNIPNPTQTDDVLLFIEDLKLHFNCLYTLLQFQTRVHHYPKGTAFYCPIKGDFYGRHLASHAVFALDLRRQEVYRLFNRSTRTLHHQIFDGLPSKMIETFFTFPVAEEVPRFRVDSPDGSFVLTPGDWKKKYPGDTSSKFLRDLGITTTTPLSEQANLL